MSANQLSFPLDMAAHGGCPAAPCSESSVNGFRCRSVFLGKHQTPVLEIDVTQDQERRMVWRGKNDPQFCVVPSDQADRMNANQMAILGFDWREEFVRRFGPDLWPHVSFRIPNA